MNFDEIIHRLTGFSVPIFGVSWTPPESERSVAKRIVIFLEDRRVLYNPTKLETPYECVNSVQRIRDLLTHELTHLPSESELTQNVKAMRIACRKFLDAVHSRDDDYLEHGFHETRLGGWIFLSAIGELRNSFGIHVALIAAKYGLEVEDNLASILPGEE